MKGRTMKLGTDFWLIFRIIKAVLAVLVDIFGDEEDRKEGNHAGLLPKYQPKK